MSSDKVASPHEMFELVTGRRSDDPSWFRFDEVELSPADIETLLGPLLTDERRSQFDRVLAERTDNATVVVEGMVDLGNVGAVMRSADGFGIQSVHAVDTADAYKRSRRTSQGADKWLDRWRWPSPGECVDHLHSQGYRVIATDLQAGAIPVDELDLTGRIAVVFGNELDGISEAMRSLADERMVIPMAGFAESFNISVAAAVTLHEVHRQRVARYGRNGDLEDTQRRRIRAVWYMKSVRESSRIVRRALADGYEPAGT
ncbi:MAG: RNA methyltransferase [Acidimicrobiia bacterium]|nr:RNA methyltransferase [Acidimicrobiia bacterium]